MRTLDLSGLSIFPLHRDEFRSNVDTIAKSSSNTDVVQWLKAVEERVCVADFPSKGSPAVEMAEQILMEIDTVLRRVSGPLDTHQCCVDVLHLMLGCLRTGPSSAGCVLIHRLLKFSGVNYKKWLQGLQGEQLKMLLESLSHVHFDDKMGSQSNDQVDQWKQTIVRVLKTASNDEKIDDKPTHKWYVELYFHFYLQTLDKAPEISSAFHDFMREIKDTTARDRNIYNELNDLDLVKKHVDKLKTIISDDKFPRHKQLVDYTEDLLRNIVKSLENTENLIDIWESLLDTVQAFVWSPNSLRLPGLLETFCNSVFKLQAKSPVKNKQIFLDAWLPWIVATLEKVSSSESLKHWLVPCVKKMVNSIGKLDKNAPVDLWIKLMMELLRWPVVQIPITACKILEKKALKEVWNWKTNHSKALELIRAIGQVELPVPGPDTDDTTQDMINVRQYTSFIVELFTQLKNAKKQSDAYDLLMEFSVTIMERRSSFLNSNLVALILPLLRLSSLKLDSAPNLMKRILVMVSDPDYPLDDGNDVFPDFTECILESYSSANQIPDIVHKIVVALLRYSLEADVEYTSHDGCMTVYGKFVRVTIVIYARKLLEANRTEVFAPVFPGLIARMTEDDPYEELLQSGRDVFCMFQSPAHVAPVCPYIGFLVRWFKESGEINAICCLSNAYKFGPKISQSMFDEAVEAIFKQNTVNQILGVMFFQEVADKQPLLLKPHIDKLMERYMYLDQPVVVMTLQTLQKYTKSCAAGMGESFITHVINNNKVPENVYFFMKDAALHVAMSNEKLAPRIFDRLLERLKHTQDTYAQGALIDGLRSLAGNYSIEMLRPHKKFFEELKQRSTSSHNSDMITNILDALEGRSLEFVAVEVQNLQDNVADLDDKVTTTEKNVVDLQNVTNQHHEEIRDVILELTDVNQRVDTVENDLTETKVKVEEIDHKTLSHAPKWSRDITKLMNTTSEHDWRLLASRLGYDNDDIRAWAQQSDPCMSLLDEWYATHRTKEANLGLLTALTEMNRPDAAAIMENAMKAVETVVEEEFEYATPSPIFLSYQWGHQPEVMLLRQHLEKAGYQCWMDIGQMGGGDKLFEKIDTGIRGSKVVICCVSEKYASSPSCNREVNLCVNLGKPIIPLLMEKMAWPPKGSMGPIFSEYLFVRFFQRNGEETNDDRYWPVAKFQEMLMQLNIYKCLPDETKVEDEYKNWWVAVAPPIVIKKKDGKEIKPAVLPKNEGKEQPSPDVFLSYQWGKQPQIKALYQKLTSMGFSCWMDIYQMGGGDSLYDKIDRGVRGCKVVVSMVTPKYALSANCRREVSLTDALKKPVIPLLLEKMDWPPPGPMSMVFTEMLYINCSSEEVQANWSGPKFDEFMVKLREKIPEVMDTLEEQEVHTLPVESVDQQSKEKQTENKTKQQSKGKQIGNKTHAAKEQQSKETPSESKSHSAASSVSSKTTTDQQKVQITAKHTMPPQNKGLSGTDNSSSGKAPAARKSSTCCIL